MGKMSDFFSNIKKSVCSIPGNIKSKFIDMRVLRLKKVPERLDVKLNHKNRKSVHMLVRNYEKQLKPIYDKSISSEEIADAKRDDALRKFDLKQHWKYRRINHAYAMALFAGTLDEQKKSELASAAAGLATARADKVAALEQERQKYLSEHPFNADECQKAKQEYEAELEKAQAEVDSKAVELRKQRHEEVEKIRQKITQKIDALFENNKSGNVLEIADDAVLNVQHLCMYFGGLHAVEDLSFDVKKGEIFGLIGPNGAGKTTVFNCITQFYKCTAGELIFRNNENVVIDLKTKAVHDVILEGMARTFQNVEVIKEISVLENLLVAATRKYSSNLFEQALGLPILSNEEKLLKERAIEILDFLDLLAYKDWLAWGLPYGVLKKVEIARALMANPKLLILDEPAAGLNNTETAQLAQLIVRIRDEFNCSILLVEHDMSLVMSICDRICAISFGKMLALGTPADIQSNKQVQEAYLGVDDGDEKAQADKPEQASKAEEAITAEPEQPVEQPKEETTTEEVKPTTKKPRANNKGKEGA